MTMRMFRSSTPAARSSSSTTGTACTLTPIQSLRISATLLELFTWSASGVVPIGFLIASLPACGASAGAGGWERVLGGVLDDDGIVGYVDLPGRAQSVVDSVNLHATAHLPGQGSRFFPRHAAAMAAAGA